MIVCLTVGAILVLVGILLLILQTKNKDKISNKNYDSTIPKHYP